MYNIPELTADFMAAGFLQLSPSGSIYDEFWVAQLADVSDSIVLWIVGQRVDRKAVERRVVRVVEMLGELERSDLVETAREVKVDGRFVVVEGPVESAVEGAVEGAGEVEGEEADVVMSE